MSDINKVTIYRFKNKIDHFAECLKEFADIDGLFDDNELMVNDGYIKCEDSEFEAYFKYDPAKPEREESKIPWTGFIKDQFSLEIPKYTNTFPSGTLIYKVNDILYLIAFGVKGMSSINSKNLVSDFGLKVAMNICDINKLKALDTTLRNGLITNTAKQIPIGADIEVFNIEDEKEFFRKISGSTKEDYNFIKNFTGKDSIKLSFDSGLNWSNLIEYTNKLEKSYISNSYKDTPFRSYDYWPVEDDEDKILKLDAQLVSKFKNGEFDNLYMTIPDIIDIDNVEFSYKKDGEFHDSLNIDDLLESHPRTSLENITIETLKSSWSIWQKSLETDIIYPSLKVYKCLTFETILDNSLYVLFNGEWRRVDSNFQSRVERELSTITEDTDLKDLIPNNIDIRTEVKDGKIQNLESTFNNELEISKPKKFLSFDKTKMEIAGNKRYEICDLITDNKKLLNVKRYKGSAESLSHLFTQIRFYSDAFVYSDTIRNQMINYINKKEVDQDIKTIFSSTIPTNETGIMGTEEFSVVALILTTDDSLSLEKLPFMAKYEMVMSYKEITRKLRMNFKYVIKKVIEQ